MQGLAGVLGFLYNGTGFVQHSCTDLKLLGPNEHSRQLTVTAAAAPVPTFLPVCWEAVSTAASAGNCFVLSIRYDMSTQSCERSSSDGGGSQSCVDAELALAAAGCSVKLITPTPINPQGILKLAEPGSAAAVSRITQVTAELGVSPDPFADPPQHTMASLMSAEVDQER